MARLSLDSERPMMAPSVSSSKRTSMRYSTFSASPSFATVDLYEQFPSQSTMPIGGKDINVSNSRSTNNNYIKPNRHPAGSLNVTAASGIAEIKQLTQGLDRLTNKELELQRFVPSEKKIDEIATLSIGAKVERALGRRLANQDATPSLKKHPLSILGHKKIDILSEKVA